MNSLAEYSPRVYENLYDFEEASEKIKVKKSYLTELGAIICQYCLEDSIGVSLLHKHFDVSPDELMVKEFISNKAYTKPQRLQNGINCVPYVWQLAWDDNSKTSSYCPLEFVTSETGLDINRRMKENLESSADFLSAFAEALLDLGLSKLLGPSTFHNEIGIQFESTQLLSETTDYSNRVLTIAPELKDEYDYSKSTETQWRFKLAKTVSALPNVTCDVRCTAITESIMHCSCGHVRT